jgi:hypothetical protein
VPRIFSSHDGVVASGGGMAGDLASTADILKGVPEGQRDDLLFRAACAFRNQLNDNRSAVEVLILHAAANCTPPFPEAQALRRWIRRSDKNAMS